MFRSLGANIWDYEIPIRFGGIPLWHRMTVICLVNGGLLVHSPTRLDVASQEEFQKLGQIVATANRLLALALGALPWSSVA